MAPTTLLFHDGELSDLRSLLGDLGTPYVERKGSLGEEDRGQAWDLVIASPKRMLDLGFASHSKSTQIAIVDRDSKTLRNSLRRHGIELMVRRPVHPAALRALVLHALYKGPEKRRSQRVSVGAPVTFSLGWRTRSGVLADISMGGFRLLAGHAAEKGKKITLNVPSDISGGKGFSVKGRVLRSQHVAGSEHQIMACFESLKPAQIDLLRRTVRTHPQGPARFDGAPMPAGPEAEAEAEDTRADAASVAEPKTSEPTLAAEETESAEESERRSEARHHIDRRVIALSEEATRVLMGRDISYGGMRVNPNPLLKVSSNVRLAIHVNGREIPLVVMARVHRDDGDRGIVLRFHQLDSSKTQILSEMLNSLPVLEADDDFESGLIVSEILSDEPTA
jgi:hypothetical protein